MSVLIKGMKIPTVCGECPFGEWSDASYFRCDLIDAEYKLIHGGKLEDCPLIEVPTPHRRLIDADNLKEFISTHDYLLSDKWNSTDKGMFTCGIFQAINEQPSAQQWIPCSERLPEDGRPVLLYAWNVHHVIARYGEFRTESGYKKTWVTADAWNGNTEITDRVIAWMPLPEPFRAESEVQDEGCD